MTNRSETTKRRLGLVSALALILALLAACGGGGGGNGSGDAGGAGDGRTVLARGNKFVPATITVKAGETVTWKFQDTASHNVVAEDRSFDSGIHGKGKTWSRTFDAAGTFDYVCTLHPTMTGKVVVTA